MGTSGKDKVTLGRPAGTVSGGKSELLEPSEDGGPILDEQAQRLIGQRLKSAYDELVRQPVPDHLLKLLEELERKEGQD